MRPDVVVEVMFPDEREIAELRSSLEVVCADAIVEGHMNLTSAGLAVHAHDYVDDDSAYVSPAALAEVEEASASSYAPADPMPIEHSTLRAECRNDDGHATETEMWGR